MRIEEGQRREREIEIEEGERGQEQEQEQERLRAGAVRQLATSYVEVEEERDDNDGDESETEGGEAEVEGNKEEVDKSSSQISRTEEEGEWEMERGREVEDERDGSQESIDSLKDIGEELAYILAVEEEKKKEEEIMAEEEEMEEKEVEEENILEDSLQESVIGAGQEQDREMDIGNCLRSEVEEEAGEVLRTDCDSSYFSGDNTAKTLELSDPLNVRADSLTSTKAHREQQAGEECEEKEEEEEEGCGNEVIGETSELDSTEVKNVLQSKKVSLPQSPSTELKQSAARTVQRVYRGAHGR